MLVYRKLQNDHPIFRLSWALDWDETVILKFFKTGFGGQSIYHVNNKIFGKWLIVLITEWISFIYFPRAQTDFRVLCHALEFGWRETTGKLQGRKLPVSRFCNNVRRPLTFLSKCNLKFLGKSKTKSPTKSNSSDTIFSCFNIILLFFNIIDED